MNGVVDGDEKRTYKIPPNELGVIGTVIGVRVCSDDVVAPCTGADILEGLEWIIDNQNTFNIDAVNMSLGTHADQSAVQDMIDLIDDLNNGGVPVFVSTGNEGDGFCTRDDDDDGICDSAVDVIYYDTLSTFAESTSFSVGSIKDPYEGGWGLSEFLSRGTGTTGPWIVSTGENIRAAEANSTNEYVTWNGTSMATPAALGVYALMLDAYFTTGVNNGGTLQFSVEDFGVRNFDKNYGNGNLVAHPSIQRAAGSTTGSFNDFRDNIYANNTITDGTWHLYNINVYGTGAEFNTTLLITNENGEELDLYIWAPGADPATDAPIDSSTGNIRLPKNTLM